MAEQPNINNLEQFTQVSTALVPQNLNKEAYVSRQFDTVGGLQPFSNLSELCDFHPNKMQLNMEANVGSDDKYRLISIPEISQYPLSQNIADANYFLNFWELKNVAIDVQKRDNLFGGSGVSGNVFNYFKLAQVNTTQSGQEINLKLSVQTNFGNTGIFELAGITSSISGYILPTTEINYTEHSYLRNVSGINFYANANTDDGRLEIWAGINNGNISARLNYSVIQDKHSVNNWSFFEDSNSQTTTLPVSFISITKLKKQPNSVEDIRISNNQLQQRKYNIDGSLAAYENKGGLITSVSVVDSGNRYIQPTINGQSSLIDLHPIIDSRLNSTPSLESGNPANNTNTNTTESNLVEISDKFGIVNTSSRVRTLMVNFECNVQRDGGGNEIIELGARRGSTITSVSSTSGTITCRNNFVINNDSVHQRTANFFYKVPANNTTWFCLYARVISGTRADFFGPIKSSYVLL